MQKQKDPNYRTYKTKPLSGLIPPVVNRALRQFGFAQTSIISNWPQIVGPKMAQLTLPSKLTFKRGARENGTLHVMVGGAEAIQFQHLMPLIIEKINMYHGFKLVGHIAITQGPVEPREKLRKSAIDKPLPILDGSTQDRLEAQINQTKSDDLKEVLRNLGRRVLGDPKNN